VSSVLERFDAEAEAVALPSRPLSSRTPDALDWAALGVTLALLSALAVGASPPVKELLLLAFVCWVPGRAVTTHWVSLKGLTLAVVTIVGGLALVTLMATVALWLHWWHPMALFIIQAVACVASLIAGIVNRDHGRQQTGEPRQSVLLAGHDAIRGGVTARHLRAPDVLLVFGLLLWAWGIDGVDLTRMDQWGLLPALPVAFYAGLAIIAASIIWLLTDRILSNSRLVLHLTALVFMIAGTPALVY